MHDGRLMRYHKAGKRTLAMLMDEAIPRRADGALALCQWCQRRVWFAGGYLDMLATRLEHLAKIVGRIQKEFVPAMRRLSVGGTCGIVTRDRERAVEAAKEVANELSWTILIQRRGTDVLRITRQPRDSDGSRNGRDREDGLDGEAATARAEGIAQASQDPSHD